MLISFLLCLFIIFPDVISKTGTFLVIYIFYSKAPPV